ncbi:MAG: ATP-binding cassette domain-containing protein [Actinomycetota bacterium]|nr:ATP-binding cassette domain-containing protein [Actinomycetota bacterium]
MTAVIEVRRLVKRFGPVVAVHELSFDVESATVTGFLGPNGAGKTTTLRALLGLVNPTSGTATVFGQPYRELDDPSRRIGAALEASGFHPGRRAIDHLRIAAIAAGIPEARAGAALAEVGMEPVAERRVGGFSLGMRQRLALAGALLGQPEVLVLDEPANGLDPEGIHWMRGFLRSYADQGGTVLISSHVLSEVAQTVDHVVIVAGGRLVASSTLAELVEHRSGGAVRMRSEQAGPLRDALVARGAAATLADADSVVVTGADARDVGRMVAETGLPVFEMTTEGSNLEDIFLDLTSSEAGDL